MYLPDRGSWETSASYAENSSKVGNTGVCLSVLCYLAPDWLCCRMHARINITVKPHILDFLNC